MPMLEASYLIGNQEDLSAIPPSATENGSDSSRLRQAVACSESHSCAIWPSLQKYAFDIVRKHCGSNRPP
jgi:hypothetical protein